MRDVGYFLRSREAWISDCVNSDLKRTDVYAGEMAKSSCLHWVNRGRWPLCPQGFVLGGPLP